MNGDGIKAFGDSRAKFDMKSICTERGLSRKYSNHFGDVAVTSSSIFNI